MHCAWELGNCTMPNACKPALGLLRVNSSRLLLYRVIHNSNRHTFLYATISVYDIGLGGWGHLPEYFLHYSPENQVVLKTNIFLSSFLFFLLKKMIPSCLIDIIVGTVHCVVKSKDFMNHSVKHLHVSAAKYVRGMTVPFFLGHHAKA